MGARASELPVYSGPSLSEPTPLCPLGRTTASVLQDRQLLISNNKYIYPFRKRNVVRGYASVYYFNTVLVLQMALAEAVVLVAC